MGVDLRLHAIIDRARVPLARLPRWLEAAAAGGVTVVQLREKDGPIREILAYGERLRTLTHRLGLALAVNDRLDIALALEADILHLGTTDLPPEIARRIAPHLPFGLSASDLEELAWALSHRPLYIGFGPVFPTPSKVDAGPPVGIAGLKQAVERSSVPIVAIGGIRPENAASVWEAGAAGIAVISALTDAEDVEQAARAILAGRPGR
jgi:thiamine-phosphate pyrophosphorylase